MSDILPVSMQNKLRRCKPVLRKQQIRRLENLENAVCIGGIFYCSLGKDLLGFIPERHAFSREEKYCVQGTDLKRK